MPPAIASEGDLVFRGKPSGKVVQAGDTGSGMDRSVSAKEKRSTSRGTLLVTCFSSFVTSK
jgi:hypothetical protein